MIVNHGSNLTKHYFMSYLNLVMSSRNYTLDKAEEFMIAKFFQGNKYTFGKDSYHQFLNALEELKISI